MKPPIMNNEDPISRAELLEIAEQQGHVTVDDIINAEAVPPQVVRGRWKPGEDEDPEEDNYDHHNWMCSACYAEICYMDPMPRAHLPNYCPNCGAKMDGGEDDAAR